jgi:hypothetical protein
MIVNYVNNYNSLLKETAVKLFTLVYYMLYLRHGDHEKAQRYYTTKLNIKAKSGILNFSQRKELKEFLLNMPLNRGKSSLNFSDDDINLSNKLGFNIENYNLAMGVFDYVNKELKAPKDELYREILSSFVDNKEYFKKYFDYAFRKGVDIYVDSYISIYAINNHEEYNHYQTFIRQKLYLENKI